MALILAIDASLSGCSACLYCSETDKIIAEKISYDDMKQAEDLAPMVRDVWGGRAIDSVAVTIGPGSFTGIRIALSFAKAFAYSLGVPLKAVNNFDAAQIMFGNDKIFLIDTKRGDFYREVRGFDPEIIARSDVTADMIEIKNLSPHSIAKASELYGHNRIEPLYIREAEVSLSKTIPPVICG